MRRLFVYPYAERPIHDSIEGFYGTTPFGGKGIPKHFSTTDSPEQADLFWMGQIADKDDWKLHPNRFQHFEKYPARHIVDLEGDWRDKEFPAWLKPAWIITGNAHLKLFKGEPWHIFVRPIMSPLLVSLVHEPPEYSEPDIHGMWFRGQRDSLGVRERLLKALMALQHPVPKHTYSFVFNDYWSVYAAEGSADRKSFIDCMKKYSTALCPRGEGMATCRFYEACAFGRAPIIIANNALPGEPNWPARISDELDVDGMAAMLEHLWGEPFMKGELQDYARGYFETVLLSYFRDPTAAFLKFIDPFGGGLPPRIR